MRSLTDRVQEIEREEILNALRECNWVMSRAARKLGITERMIGYKVRKYKIRKEEKTADSRRQTGREHLLIRKLRSSKGMSFPRRRESNVFDKQGE